MGEPGRASIDEILAFYQGRGYRQRIGPGRRPAVIVIDFSCAFTRGTGEFPGGDFAGELRHTRRLLDAARGRAPIIYTTIAYEPDLRDAGFWGVKVPWLGHCRLDSSAVEIDHDLGVRPDETVMVKKYPSAFFGTDLDARLKAANVDTLIVAGCTTSVCVRATTLDAMQHGYRPLVAAEAVGDFLPALHQVHLADLDSRYADVLDVDDLVAYLSRLPAEPGRRDPDEARR